MATDFSLKIESTSGPAQLPFDENQQQALMGHVMQKDVFFKQVYNRLEPGWFTDPDVSKIFTAYCGFYKHYDHIPNSLDEFRAWQDFQALDQADRVRINNKITLCHAKTQTFGVDYLAEQITVWQKMQLCVNNLPQIANLVNTRKLDKAEQLLHTTSKDLLFSSFQQDPVANWEDWRGVRESELFDMENAISCGLSILDRKILPEGKSGCLLPGDTTVIVAPMNGGKSQVCLTIARHAIFARKSVLWITREGRQNDMMTKMYMSVFNKSKSELWAWSATPEGEREMDAMTKLMNRRLHYIHIPRVNAYVEDVVGDITRMQSARLAEYGHGYDLVVNGHPAIFQAKESIGARWDERKIVDYMYRQFVQLACEQKFHCLLAAQTNREGSKVNKGLTNKRLLGAEDIAEAFGVAMSASNVITVNRDERAQAHGYVTYYVVKSRTSGTGWAVTAKSNFGHATTHSDALGGTAYHSNIRLSDQIPDLLRNYNNRDIPEGAIDGYKIAMSEKKDEDSVV